MLSPTLDFAALFFGLVWASLPHIDSDFVSEHVFHKCVLLGAHIFGKDSILFSCYAEEFLVWMKGWWKSFSLNYSSVLFTYVDMRTRQNYSSTWQIHELNLSYGLTEQLFLIRVHIVEATTWCCFVCIGCQLAGTLEWGYLLRSHWVVNNMHPCCLSPRCLFFSSVHPCAHLEQVWLSALCPAACIPPSRVSGRFVQTKDTFSLT